MIKEKAWRKQIEMLHNTFVKTFSYSTREFDEVMTLVKFRNSAAHEYYRGWIDLDDKKEKLFSSGDLKKWEIDFKEAKLPQEEIAKSKQIAKTLMLPQVVLDDLAYCEYKKHADDVWFHQSPVSRTSIHFWGEESEAVHSFVDRTL